MKEQVIKAAATVIRALVGADTWELIVAAVNDQEPRYISNTEKHQAVVETVRAFGISTTGWIVDLAIKTAVSRLKVS